MSSLALLTIPLLLNGCAAAPDDQAANQPERWDAELAQQDPSEFGSSEFQSEAQLVFANPTDESGRSAPGPSAAETSGWTILLARLDTSKPDLIDGLLQRLRQSHPDAKLVEREGVTFLAHGSYTSPNERAAQRDLEQLRNYAILNGEQRVRPYILAYLAPPLATDLSGSIPEHDLRNVKARFGESALYTLQVGIYGRTDRTSPTREQLIEFRRAAEDAARQLRRDGQQAFYYHGTSRSTVTVGVFGEADHDPSTRPPLESSRLRAAREAYPYNLLNGQGMNRVTTDASGQQVRRQQPSFLVAVP